MKFFSLKIYNNILYKIKQLTCSPGSPGCPFNPIAPRSPGYPISPDGPRGPCIGY